MKICVFSDLHGSYYYTNKIKEIIDREKPDKIILLGDLYYHGPRNPLPKDYRPMEVAKILNEYSSIISWTRGNCDAQVDEMISSFKAKDHILLNIHHTRMFFTHGHVYNDKHIPRNTDILIYGHFHTGFIKQVGKTLCINAGSVSIPKKDTPHSYLLITDEEIFLKDLQNHTIDKTSYPCKKHSNPWCTILYVLAVFLLVLFDAFLVFDFVLYNASFTAPITVFILRRAIQFLLPCLILVIVAKILERKKN